MLRGEPVPERSPLFKEVLISEEQVAERIDELATNVIERYKDKDPLFVCLLRGGAPFASMLMFSIARQDPGFHPELDYMTVSTYGERREAGSTRIVMDLGPKTVVKDRPVVLLDDVLDEGITAAFTTTYLAGRGAQETDLIVLVQKDRERTAFGDATLFGFEAPGDWLTGMGMDDRLLATEGNRWMASIALANTE
ncbi:MAG TPA: phosphoribosyltransferase family protein [Verrucomicrobiae bacterium]|nr:phosphoribosyltransferase family protein [Verrucomicrobiae bacterium]